MPRPRIAPAGSLSRLGSAAFIAVALASPAVADGRCVDLNSASVEELGEIIHIDEERSGQILVLRQQRPFESVWQITRVRGIAKQRRDEIRKQGLACVDGDRGTRR